jgi:hypothetical protein
MKVINICIFFFISFGTAIGQSDTGTNQPIFPQQLTASDLLTYCSSSSMTDLGRTRQRYCWGFVSGVEETVRLPLRTTMQPIASTICVPKGVSSRSMGRAYSQYAARRGANLARPAVEVVIEALSNAYPCSD